MRAREERWAWLSSTETDAAYASDRQDSMMDISYSYARLRRRDAQDGHLARQFRCGFGRPALQTAWPQVRGYKIDRPMRPSTMRRARTARMRFSREVTGKGTAELKDES
jgi:hypothetical protein